ncbi:hypothetical protein [[Mannheimia] succiniciproducens]|uniref:Uncharacterized protein n=1 Tax=Mannheimia succiniciproducens (strain KCTC 0769BP / MBEL55E) TaxID=221988 RepID=Q65UT7_MANSM|nr:hypothetical protein [[Mannheimia] succiniciproducens]AAU37273.1 unknown [[Mannheimia] succiniciproducens MBEL55E]
MGESKLAKIEHLIAEINKLHCYFTNDYFKLGKYQKIDFNNGLTKVPLEHILSYRLNLHESNNDYLYCADLYDIAYFYRVKTSESILDKIERFKQRSEG